MYAFGNGHGLLAVVSAVLRALLREGHILTGVPGVEILGFSLRLAGLRHTLNGRAFLCPGGRFISVGSFVLGAHLQHTG
eukprot:164955-Amorphochlora_amoeboformis.AAC.2